MEVIFKEYKLLLIVLSTIFGAIMAITLNTLRIKLAKKPVSYKKIIIPPLMMSTGLFMFVFPFFRIPWQLALEALIVGIIFSILLIRTTKFKVFKQKVYLIPSKAFVFILFGLLFLRILGKIVLGQTIDVGEVTSMFYLLALGMILTWRFVMAIKYKRLKYRLKNK